ncbi:MAG: hypothetical protein FD133_1358 [Erysipelotrichaceae bacterium]|nr:MAG: hypothetical protein FD179_644 [Erysipelotrichaceae bacterium]TXT17504.1 MAG: hypothetical protein FD133_1358 [Erysipelotrichaceae bacterium]
MIIRMKKRKLKLRRILIPLTVLGFIVGLYVFFSAKKQEVSYFKAPNSVHIAFKDLVSEMETSKTAYFFCTESNVDCRYVDKEILDFLLIDANVEKFDNIFLVDTSTLGPSILPSILQKRFGFTDVPAFAILSYENGKIIIHSAIQWTNSEPFTAHDLKEWMKENQLWLKEYTN